MTQVNQKGEPVQEDTIYSYFGNVCASMPITEDVRDKAIALLCEKLQVEIVLTNATKHGTTELVLRDCK